MIESNKMFPIAAWAAFVTFIGLTLYLTFELKQTAEYLEAKTFENVTAVKGIKINN